MKTLKSLGKKEIDQIRKKVIRTYQTTVGVITWDQLAEKMRELYKDKTKREMAVYFCGYLNGIEHERERRNTQIEKMADNIPNIFGGFFKKRGD